MHTDSCLLLSWCFWYGSQFVPRVAELLGEEITTGDQGNVVGDGDESGDDNDGDDNNDHEDDDNKLEEFNETTVEDAAENVQDVAVEFCKILASTEEKDRTTEAENVCVTAEESKIIENTSEADESVLHDQKRHRQT